jgi:hypothetical protein
MSSKRMLQFLLAQAQHRGIQINVFAPSKFRIESGAEFQQRGDAASRFNGSAGRRKRPADDLQQGGLARPVATDDADGFALPDLEGNVVQRTEFTVILFRYLPCHSLQTRQDELLEPITRRLVDLVALAEIA